MGVGWVYFTHLSMQQRSWSSKFLAQTSDQTQRLRCTDAAIQPRQAITICGENPKIVEIAAKPQTLSLSLEGTGCMFWNPAVSAELDFVDSLL